MAGYAMFLRAGTSLPAEVHPDATQFFHVVQGKGTFIIDGYCYVPPGTRHEVKALTDMRMLTIYSH